MKRAEFLRGLYAGIPICLGYLSVSFAFGIFAVESGLSLLTVAAAACSAVLLTQLLQML